MRKASIMMFPTLGLILETGACCHHFSSYQLFERLQKYFQVKIIVKTTQITAATSFLVSAPHFALFE
jgi:hypothetical protein